MIEVIDLIKKIGPKLILDNISFTVAKGEILGLLGPNGAGKTTTMKIITSFWTPTSGQVKVGGLDVVRDSIKTREKIGYLPETVPLYDEMRVYEYLKFIAEIRGIAKIELNSSIKKAIASCSLEKVIRQPIEELSKGYRQRLGLAQAIIHEPDILILDEPTTGLDPNQIVEIRDLIREIGKEKAVIFSTHILSEVSATCDRTVIINDGKIVAEGKPEELAKKAGGREVIYVKIKGPREQVLEKLKDMENVVNVEIKDKESDDIYGYNIEPQAGVDLREYLSMTIMNNNWSMLEVNRRSVSLEDVFMELTK